MSRRSGLSETTEITDCGGALLLAERGRLFASLPAGGRMVAVFEHADNQPAAIGDRPTMNTSVMTRDVGNIKK